MATNEETISRSQLCNIVKPKFIKESYFGIRCLEDNDKLEPVDAQNLIMNIRAIGKLCGIELRFSYR